MTSPHPASCSVAYRVCYRVSSTIARREASTSVCLVQGPVLNFPDLEFTGIRVRGRYVHPAVFGLEIAESKQVPGYCLEICRAGKDAWATDPPVVSGYDPAYLGSYFEWLGR